VSVATATRPLSAFRVAGHLLGGQAAVVGCSLIVRAWFGAATLALSTVVDNPRLAGNSANKVFDALAASCPVGVNHGGSLATMLVREQAGIVLSPAGPRAGAQTVASFVHDVPDVEKARDGAIRMASYFGRDVLYRQFEQVIESAVTQPGTPHRRVTMIR
jgi:hypothetical protein